MQLYQQQGFAGTNGRRQTLPARVHTADGKLVAIGVPDPSPPATARGNAAAREDGAGGSASAVIGGGSVILFPEKVVWEERLAPRFLLLVLILLDAGIICWMLAELSWRQLNRTHVTLLGVLGLFASGIGCTACFLPWPRLLGAYSVLAAVQLFVCSVLIHSVPQLLHFGLQPLLYHEATELRAALLPAWFSTGRLVRSLRPRPPPAPAPGPAPAPAPAPVAPPPTGS